MNTIPAGQTSGSFTVKANSPGKATITATVGFTTLTRSADDKMNRVVARKEFGRRVDGSTAEPRMLNF